MAVCELYPGETYKAHWSVYEMGRWYLFDSPVTLQVIARLKPDVAFTVIANISASRMMNRWAYVTFEGVFGWIILTEAKLNRINVIP